MFALYESAPLTLGSPAVRPGLCSADCAAICYSSNVQILVPFLLQAMPRQSVTDREMSLLELMSLLVASAFSIDQLGLLHLGIL